MLKNVLKILIIFFVGMMGGIFADQIFWPYFLERPLFFQYQRERQPIFITEKKEVIIQEKTALEEGIKKVENTVIGVRTILKKGKALEGSGLVLTSDGLVVSLASLVPIGSGFNFYLGKEKVSFQILKRDLKEDLALIKIGKDNLVSPQFFDLEKLERGQRVFLVGVTFEEKGIKKIIDEGIISDFDEEKIVTNILEKGNFSGAPLFNLKGEALGIIKIEQGKVIVIPISKIKTFSGL